MNINFKEKVLRSIHGWFHYNCLPIINAFNSKLLKHLMTKVKQFTLLIKRNIDFLVKCIGE